MYLRKTINILLLVSCLGLFEKVELEHWDLLRHHKYDKVYMMVLLIELYLFIPVSVAFTIIPGHSNVEQF